MIPGVGGVIGKGLGMVSGVLGKGGKRGGPNMMAGRGGALIPRRASVMPRLPGTVSGGGIGGGRLGRIGGAIGGIAGQVGMIAGTNYVLDRFGNPVRRRRRSQKGVTGRDIKGANRVAKLVQKFGFKPKMKERKKRK